MYILNVQKGSSGLLFEVTKCHFEGPIRILPAEAAGLTQTTTSLTQVRRQRRVGSYQTPCENQLWLQSQNSEKMGSPVMLFFKKLPEWLVSKG